MRSAVKKLRKLAFRNRLKIFTTNNHYEWSKCLSNRNAMTLRLNNLDYSLLRIGKVINLSNNPINLHCRVETYYYLKYYYHH